MSKLLANQIANYTDNGPVEAKEGLNVANGKPFQVAGAAGTSGDYLKSTGSSVAWSTFPTIPAAQVNSDWNSTSGLSQILNKPTLHAVATSGQYGDLSGLPTIPAAQVQVNWNQSNSSAVDFIQNKPTLFSGSYNDLTNKPTIPSNLHDLTNVASTAPANNDVLSWNGSNWAPSATGAGGSTTFVGLTDTPANFTSQAGKWLKVNAGATALEYATAPYDTSYSQSAVASGSNVNLRLTSSQAVNDDILITAGSNITIANVTAGGFTISSNPDTNTSYTIASIADSSNVKLRLAGSDSVNDDVTLTAGSGVSFSAVTSDGFTISATGTTLFTGLTDTPANYTNQNNKILKVNSAGSAIEFVTQVISTTSDTAPSSPNDGDLWWKSDEGRLKVYYDDGSGSPSTQWVDASPLLTPTSMASGSNSIAVTSTRSTVTGPLRVTGTLTGNASNNQIAYASHFIPDTNAAYDLGNAEYKVRHLFLSDNTVYFEGDFLKVAQHNSGGSAQSASYLIPLAKLKDALTASADYEAFKTAILAITDA